MFAPILLAIALLVQQHSTRDYTIPPSDAPLSCSMTEMASLSTIQGSDSYVATRYELASLAKAEDGAKSVDQASAEMKASTDLGEALTKMLSGTQDGEDIYCVQLT